MERIGNFGRASFVPLGKTQRSLDESADSDGDGGLTERDGHSHRGEDASPSSHQAEDDEDEEDEDDEEGSELVAGDLDAEIEDMDNPGGRSAGEETAAGLTDRSGEGRHESTEL